MTSTEALLDACYASMDGNQAVESYYERHGVRSAAILTVKDDETAHLVAGYLDSRVRGKVVVEIGSGIGLLALHLSDIASKVYCIEANPSWTWLFVGVLYAQKPKNVSWLFGAADEFVGMVEADVAIFCTHSDSAGMRRIAERFAPEVIDVYGELVSEDWNMLRKARR